MSERAVILLVLVPAASALMILFTFALTLALGKRLERLESLLPEWAERNGYRILKRERRFFFCGPFFFSSRYSDVCRLTVQGRQGGCRAGWVRIGEGPLGSLLSDRIEVVWDDAAPPGGQR